MIGQSWFACFLVSLLPCLCVVCRLCDCPQVQSSLALGCSRARMLRHAVRFDCFGVVSLTPSLVSLTPSHLRLAPFRSVYSAGPLLRLALSRPGAQLLPGTQPPRRFVTTARGRNTRSVLLCARPVSALGQFLRSAGPALGHSGARCSSVFDILLRSVTRRAPRSQYLVHGSAIYFSFMKFCH